MFTGIIEEIGKVKELNRSRNSAVIEINAKKVLKGTKLGQSIAVNGICLTVTNITESSFKVDVMPETMKSSNLKDLKINEHVNLERAMQVNDRFDGHIVSGHVDGVGKIMNITKNENAFIYKMKIDNSLNKYIIKKGSITIDGISLTVVDIKNDEVKVSIIPTTQDETILKYKQVGSIVNIECDMIGKYIEKMLPNKESKKIDKNFLSKNGFM
ncbi:MAG: riboflavin synthase [Bacillota bacterium]